jgi:D-serine deaminase-like pyridoxal phosphate-dependent protein
MVDCPEHLDLIGQAAAAAGAGPVPLRVCIDIDASFSALGGRVRAGALRSPVRTPPTRPGWRRTSPSGPGCCWPG